MGQEIVNLITASLKRLQCIDVAYMYMYRPFYTAKPVQSQLGTPCHFTVLSQVTCKTEGGKPLFVSARAFLVDRRRRGFGEDGFIICILQNVFIFL